ncbi:hypothetical protein [Massilia sp. TWP1-3-3]|uniref:hypothetical protein n=1 Tax=Massilia sp. TWP1-3-3 TaxID=2804573 RepID=UPI003CEF5081
MRAQRTGGAKARRYAAELENEDGDEENWCGWRGSNPRPLASEAMPLIYGEAALLLQLLDSTEYSNRQHKANKAIMQQKATMGTNGMKIPLFSPNFSPRFLPIF